MLFSFLLMNPSVKEILDFRISIEREVLMLAVDNAEENEIEALKENIKKLLIIVNLIHLDLKIFFLHFWVVD